VSAAYSRLIPFSLLFSYPNTTHHSKPPHMSNFHFPFIHNLISHRRRMIDIHFISLILTWTLIKLNLFSMFCNLHFNVMLSIVMSSVCFCCKLTKITVRPLTVKILKDLKFMSTKSTYNLKCEVRGSRPAAKISWWLGSQQLTDTKEMVRIHSFIFLIKILMKYFRFI
jgi:hypothetical protein